MYTNIPPVRLIAVNMSDSRPAFAYGYNHVKEEADTLVLPEFVVKFRKAREAAHLWADMMAGRGAKGQAMEATETKEGQPAVEDVTITHATMRDLVVKRLFGISTTKRADGTLKYETAEMDIPGRPGHFLWIKVDPNFTNGRPGDWRMVLASAMGDQRNVEAWMADGAAGNNKPVTMEAWAGPRIKVQIKKRL